jgi:hypothetical protein
MPVLGSCSEDEVPELEDGSEPDAAAAGVVVAVLGDVLICGVVVVGAVLCAVPPDDFFLGVLFFLDVLVDPSGSWY